jgi:alpha-ketoglutarate-dependent taurine dioxygenase
MQTSNSCKCTPVTTTIGAVIEGIDISEPLNGEAKEFIQNALIEYGVVFFRDQILSNEQMNAFATNFAQTMHEPFSPEVMRDRNPATEGNMLVAKHATAVWHHDTTFVPEAPWFTVLRAVRIPPCGGDTCWASMYAAYDALSPNIRKMLDGLTAVHSVMPVMQRMGEMARKHLEASRSFHGYDCVHPVVIAHPVSGRKALFVNEAWTTHIVELSPAESRYVLAMLFDHVKLPTFNVRWRWTPNDVAMWDNRAVQHFAVPDYSTDRVMQRVITRGPRPVAAQ